MPISIGIDVEAGENCDYSLQRAYSAVNESVAITQIEAPGDRGEDTLYDVVGWSSEGPVTAYAATVEDSGEGRALLIYGGSDGIRLRPAESQEPWSLDDSDQIGEPCLLLDLSAVFVPIEQ